MKIFSTACTYDDFAGAVRVLLGCDAEREEGPVLIGAIAQPNGEDMLELSAGTVDAGKPVVVLVLDDPCNPSEATRIILFQPIGRSLAVHMGLTLWAANDRDPAVLVFADVKGTKAFGIGSDGLRTIARPALGLDNSPSVGMERATRRLVRTAINIASLRGAESVAA